MSDSLRRRDVLKAALGTIPATGYLDRCRLAKAIEAMMGPCTPGLSSDGPSLPSRTLVFPDNEPVGWLEISVPGKDSIGDPFPAVGRVTVPAGKQVTLIMFDECRGGLSWLRNLQPDDLHAFYGWFSHGLLDLADFSHLSGLREFEIQDVEVIAEAWPGWRGLQSVKYLGLYRTSLPDGTVSSLYSMTSLETVELSNCKFSEADQVLLDSPGRPGKYHVYPGGPNALPDVVDVIDPSVPF